MGRQLTKERKLRVADMFCGGGGISEGLRQAGLEIVYGLDSNNSAVETFAKNHPKAKAVKARIEDLDERNIPEFDVLVGGPPCVEFSASKQGRGNILDGLKLVQAFLRLVHTRRPKFWVMENVPKIVMHLPEKIPLAWIGVDQDGYLDVPVRTHFFMADYGIPQARERFLMGNFPIPESTHFDPAQGALLGLAEGKREWKTLRQVIESLPSPIRGRSSVDTTVTDLNYGIDLPIDKLTDHFHEVELSTSEAKGLRKAKEAHPFMGWMPFPDRVDRPSRTVVATQLGRETLIIGEKIDQEDRFRRATVRECAVMQGYPITYQFLGPSLSARYKIVGNSVPPLFCFHLGREIQKSAGREVPLEPDVHEIPLTMSDPIIKLQIRDRAEYKLTRRFCELVPGKEVRGCRIELTNLGTEPHLIPFSEGKIRHLVEWKCRLSVGEGKANLRQKFLSVKDCEEILAPIFADPRNSERVAALRSRVELEVLPNLCDATTLQASWCERITNAIHPEDLVEKLAEVIDEFYPREQYRDVFIRSDTMLDFLPKKGLRVRLALGALLTGICCEAINDGTSWLSDESNPRYPVSTTVVSPRPPIPARQLAQVT